MQDLKQVEIKSNKLNKNIMLEGYESLSDGTTVITATSLKNVFEPLKKEFGITDSIKSDIRVNAVGNVIYASVEWTIRDKDGYESTFVGEATPDSLNTTIAKQYPKVTALNRAQSIGIKTYLQLPKGIYTNEELSFNTTSSDKQKPEDNSNDGEKVKNEQSVIHKNGIVAKLENAKKTEKTAAEILNDKLSGSISNVPTLTAENEVAAEISGDNANNNNIDDDSVVPIGIFAGKTVKELFEINTPTSQAFIRMCKLGQATDPDPVKMEIIKYIASKAE